MGGSAHTRCVTRTELPQASFLGNEFLQLEVYFSEAGILFSPSVCLQKMSPAKNWKMVLSFMNASCFMTIFQWKWSLGLNDAGAVVGWFSTRKVQLLVSRNAHLQRVVCSSIFHALWWLHHLLWGEAFVSGFYQGSPSEITELSLNYGLRVGKSLVVTKSCCACCNLDTKKACTCHCLFFFLLLIAVLVFSKLMFWIRVFTFSSECSYVARLHQRPKIAGFAWTKVSFRRNMGIIIFSD